ncbi:hypothetical protein ACFXPQ_27920 [Streptomyces lydicus]
MAHAPLDDAEWSCLGRQDFRQADALDLWLRVTAGLDVPGEDGQRSSPR